VFVADEKRYDSMQYRRSGRSGIRLPALSLGLWHNFGGVDNFENCRAMLRRAFDLGITHFDLANNYGPPYGSAAETFGQIFKKDFLPYRDDHLDESGLGHVARALRKSGLAQIHAGEPRSEPETHGARIR
jgi:L-glyceraldehyde 3-phosphate reductase